MNTVILMNQVKYRFMNVQYKYYKVLLFILINILLIFFEIVLIVQGSSYTIKASIQTAPTTGISMVFIFCSMPIGGLLMLFITCEKLIISTIISILPDHIINDNFHNSFSSD